MAHSHLAYSDLALDNFSGTDPDQDAESFIQLFERKINFALSDAPGDADQFGNYTFRMKALLSSLLRGTAAERYENNITNATTCESVPTFFITTFSDRRSNFRYSMEMNVVSQEMEKKFETFYAVSNEQLTQAGLMI